MIEQTKIELQELPIKDLKPAKYNPRTMSDKSFDALVESIKGYGQRENLILNKDMTVISGHMRLLAMKHLGYTTAMCDVLDITKIEEKKLNLIMNNPHMQGEFDTLKVDEILAELRMSETDLDLLRLPELGTLDLSNTTTEGEAPEVCKHCKLHCPTPSKNTIV